MLKTDLSNLNSLELPQEFINILNLCVSCMQTLHKFERKQLATFSNYLEDELIGEFIKILNNIVTEIQVTNIEIGNRDFPHSIEISNKLTTELEYYQFEVN